MNIFQIEKIKIYGQSKISNCDLDEAVTKEKAD